MSNLNTRLHTRARPQPPNVQTRRMAIPAAEMRFEGGTDGKPFTFSGYAVKWDSVNTYGEKFQRGAFADLIASGKPIHMYYNHSYLNWGANPYRIGKWIELREDDTGLFVKGELTPNLQLAADVAAMLKHGTIDGLSIAFYAPAEMDIAWLDGVLLIKRVDVYEISVVDEPSDRSARIDLNDQTIAAVESERDALELLRGVGMSERAAESLLARLATIAPTNQAASDPAADPLAFLDSR